MIYFIRFQWAGLHRIHIRLQKGIPPMHDLLTVDQDYVVRAVAYALRNMAIDATNKWSIGNSFSLFSFPIGRVAVIVMAALGRV